ncbi:radical SAM protein [Candidatus Woesearchaeota archaeon]|nr:radical SAM protein [Candidatus Woesearchaeota archaeon]
MQQTIALKKTIAAIELTSRCNLNCGFCVSMDDNVEMPTQKVKAVIDQLSPSITRVVFIGGEPLLRKDLPELLAYAKAKGHETKVHTNGYLLPAWKEEQLALIDILNVPLDSYKQAVNDTMRAPGSFHVTLRTLDWMRRLGKKISITTVLTKENYADMHGLRDLLAQYDHIVSWKIFKFHPTGNGERNRERFSISEEIFDAATQDLRLPNAKVFAVKDFFSWQTAEFY